MCQSAENVGANVTKILLDRIHHHLTNAEIIREAGEVRFIDHDESCLYFGLFQTNPESGIPQKEPSIIWTLEVSSERKGGNQS